MAGFEIDGRDYPVPSVFNLTMGEAQVLFDYSGYTLEDFVPPMPDVDDPRLAMLRDPAFKRAMVHIAYQRGNPGMARDEISALVDGVQMFEMTAAMYAGEEDPTEASQNVPQTLSDDASPLTPQSSGRLSNNGSDEPDATLAPIGIIG